jgi:hypothetical protein
MASRKPSVFLDTNWKEIAPQRSVTADTFAQGSILFSFNVSGLNSISLKDSYFLIKSSLVAGSSAAGAGVVAAHVIDNKTTYAHNWTSALFTNVALNVSGVEISSCNQFNHLAHTLKMRQMIDDNELKTNYRDLMDFDPDFTRRLNRHCPTGQREDGLVEQASAAGAQIRSGDTSRYTIYKPVNLGVFDLGHGDICGDIQITLNPNPNFLTACVESAFIFNNNFVAAVPGASALAANTPPNYRFQIEEIKFMACFAKVTEPITTMATFAIKEYQIQNKPYATQLEFQVAPSTEQITVFIQDQSAGNSTIIPSTAFKVRQYLQNEQTGWVNNYGKQFTADEQGSFQVTLGATTKPPIMLKPQVNVPNRQYQLIRWLMSNQYLQCEPGTDGGRKNIWERFTEWASSPYFTFDFARDATDTSGFVTVMSMYDFSGYALGLANNATTWPNGGQLPNLFCCSRYVKQVRITYNSGYVTDVQIQNT